MPFLLGYALPPKAISLMGKRESVWKTSRVWLIWRRTERSDALYDRGDLDRTQAVVRLLIDTFEDDAESHNYLGMIALDRGNLDEAAKRFTMMMELARKRLPRRLSLRLFRNNHRGKPYRRGLSNLILTLNRQGQYDKALAHADQLEKVCGDDAGAEDYRALIHLNRGEGSPACPESVAGNELRCCPGLFPNGEVGRSCCRLPPRRLQPCLSRPVDCWPAPQIAVPFKTVVLDVEVTVEAVDMTDDDQIVAICKRGGSRQRMLIFDPPLPNPRPKGAEWIDAYRRARVSHSSICRRRRGHRHEERRCREL